MKFSPSYTIIKVLAACVLIACMISCSSGAKHTESRIPPDELLREGDLVFRLGMGVSSRIVLAADDQGVYSHTGILTRQDDEWYVIHAVPYESDGEDETDRVKLEPLAKFWASDRAAKGAVMRTDAGDSLASCATGTAMEIYARNTLFDHDYDMTDTTKMYCTELIQYSYMAHGVDIAEGHESSMIFLKHKCLLPLDLIKGNHLTMIYSFNY